MVKKMILKQLLFAGALLLAMPAAAAPAEGLRFIKSDGVIRCGVTGKELIRHCAVFLLRQFLATPIILRWLMFLPDKLIRIWQHKKLM